MKKREDNFLKDDFMGQGGFTGEQLHIVNNRRVLYERRGQHEPQ